MKNTVLATILCAALLAFVPSAVANTTVVYTTPISQAGQTVFDGTYLWALSGFNVVALNSSGSIVVTQNVGFVPTYIACDVATGIIYVLGSVSGGGEMGRFSGSTSISTGGNAGVEALTLPSAPTALAIDEHARFVWALAGGIAYQFAVRTYPEITASLSGAVDITILGSGGTAWLTSPEVGVTEVTY